jgi:hypothetical protein
LPSTGPSYLDLTRLSPLPKASVNSTDTTQPLNVASPPTNLNPNSTQAQLGIQTSLQSSIQPQLISQGLSPAGQKNPYFKHIDATIYHVKHTSSNNQPLPPTAAYTHDLNMEGSIADTLTQRQMFKATDSDHFIAAQTPEINGLLLLGVFNVQHISSKPQGARLLSSIWSYWRKRSPIGKLLKYKARLCVDGSPQEFGRDFWETYAPVVSWSTVRLLLLLSTILRLKTRQVNYTQAFPQALLDDPVSMRMPQGWFVSPEGNFQAHSDPKFQDTQHFIRLKKNLYGCK